MPKPKREEKLDLQKIKNVLVLRLDQIGDVVMTSPFLRELRRNFPNAHITLIVRSATYGLVQNCPYVNEILTYNFDTRDYWGKYFTYFIHSYRTWALAFSRLRKKKFDLAIIPRSDADYYQATFISYLSGARMRLGYTENFYEWKGKFNYGFDKLLTHVLNPAPKHEVENGLEIIKYLGGRIENTKIEAWLNPADIEFAQRIKNEHKLSEDSLVIALGVGANADKRQWPILSFIELAQWLNQQFKAKILLVGGKNEESLGREFEKNFSKDTINVLGKANLRQTIAALKMCKIFIGNDSGPMHLATAAGIKVVEISSYPRNGKPWHPNSPKLYGPWGVPSVIRQPEQGLDNCKNGCEATKAHCITQITVDAIQQAVLSLIERRDA